MTVLTIGLFGFSEAAFFEELRKQHVDTFCDIRWRRGVRGAEYAFANSARLQHQLATMGIRYLHFRHLAPNPRIRKRQADVDKAAHVAKRKRTTLSEDFIRLYREENLSPFKSEDFLENLGPEASVVALFCVERQPAACHRSLLAERLRADLGDRIEVKHVAPL